MKKNRENISMIEFTYAELTSNIIKRLLLLIGKLTGYKGAAVVIATKLLISGYIGETAWVSAVISALCGIIMPKTLSKIGKEKPDEDSDSLGDTDRLIQ
jgi:hypothetical protein